MKVLQGISPEELDGKLHAGQPDTPQLGTVGMQELFDAQPNLIREKLNELVEDQNENNLELEQSGTGTQQQLDNHQADTANPHSVTKAQVGLGSVDNTSDMDKPVSNAQSAAIGAVQSNLSAHVSDDVIHVTQSDKDTWGNKPNLGETAGTAYWGDRGKIAYDHSQSTGNPHETEIGDIEGLTAALSGKANASDVLTKSNATPFIPSAPYHPATKEYADSLALEAGAVTSVFGRAGAVVAGFGDYTTDQIADDATNNKFVTESEKGYWNGKADYSLSDTTAPTVTLTDLPENPKSILTIYGKTLETGTGEKSPDNPYTLTGVGESGSVPIVVSDGTDSQTADVPVSAPLYSLPNGVRDEVDASGGEIIRRVGKAVIDGNAKVTKMSQTETTAGVRAAFYARIGESAIVNMRRPQTAFIHVDWIATSYPTHKTYNSTDAVYRGEVNLLTLDRTTSVYDFAFNIPVASMPGYDVSLTTAQKESLATAWLSTNPVTVIYELAEPIIENIPSLSIPIYAPTSTITTTDPTEPELRVEVLNPKPVSDSWQLGGKMWNEYITKEEINTAEKILPATCTYSSGVFTLSGLPDNLPDIFTVRFKAPADFAEGDTFSIGELPLPIKLINMTDAPDGAFKEGAVVLLNIDTTAECAFLTSSGLGQINNILFGTEEPTSLPPGTIYFQLEA